MFDEVSENYSRLTIDDLPTAVCSPSRSFSEARPIADLPAGKAGSRFTKKLS